MFLLNFNCYILFKLHVSKSLLTFGYYLACHEHDSQYHYFWTVWATLPDRPFDKFQCFFSKIVFEVHMGLT